MTSHEESLETDGLLDNNEHHIKSFHNQITNIDHDDMLSEAGRHIWTISGIIAVNCAMLGIATLESAWGYGLAPKDLEQVFPPDKKGTYMTVFYSIQLILCLAFPLTIAWILDRKHTSKRVVMMVGTIIMMVGLVLFFQFGSISVAGFVCPFIVITLGLIIFDTAFNPILGSNFADARQGLVSGLIGSLTMLGFIIAGLALLAHSDAAGITYGIIGGVLGLSIFPTIYCAWEPPQDDDDLLTKTEVESSPETEIAHKAETGFMATFMPALRSSDFLWVVANRCLTKLGISIVWQFTWLWDESKNPEFDTPNKFFVNFAHVLFATCSVAAICSFAIGLFKDSGLVSHKWTIFYADALMGVCVIVLIFVPANWLQLLVMGFFGIGFGIFVGMEFSMVCTVLPEPDNLASTFALWEVGTLFPILLLEPILGVAFDALSNYGKDHNMPMLASSLVFTFGAVVLFVAALTCLKYNH